MSSCSVLISTPKLYCVLILKGNGIYCLLVCISTGVCMTKIQFQFIGAVSIALLELMSAGIYFDQLERTIESALKVLFGVPKVDEYQQAANLYYCTILDV